MLDSSIWLPTTITYPARYLKGKNPVLADGLTILLVQTMKLEVFLDSSFSCLHLLAVRAHYACSLVGLPGSFWPFRLLFLPRGSEDSRLSASSPPSSHSLLLDSTSLDSARFPSHGGQRGKIADTKMHRALRAQAYCLPRRGAFTYTCQHMGSGSLAHMGMQVCKCTLRTSKYAKACAR